MQLCCIRDHYTQFLKFVSEVWYLFDYGSTAYGFREYHMHR